MDALTNFLATLPPGAFSDTYQLERLLAAHWDELGGDEGGMAADKLFNRMERVRWEPPKIKFVIERHGGTMMGSTRAELQHWVVDVEAGTAWIEKTGHRQLYAMEEKISLKAIAQEISQSILDGKQDDRVSRDGDELVVWAQTLFPKGSGYNRTVESRRQRLCAHIEKMLREHGWKKVGWNKFRLISGKE